MTESDVQSYLSIMPTEVLINIFTYVPAKQLIKCREICSRWKEIIDDLSRSQIMWEFFCQKDFPTLYKSAYRKCHVGLYRYHVYRSLTLWPKLTAAKESRDEFALSLNVKDEVQDFTLLGDGTIGVHTKCKIVYYDVSTLQISDREPINGNYLRYSENDDTVVVLSYQLHLFVVRKHFSSPGQESNVTFDGIKMFLMIDRKLFFVNLINEIYLCHLDDKNLKSTLLNRLDEGVMSLGYNKEQLNVLAVNRTIYTMNENNLVPACSLTTHWDMLHKLHEYNLLEQLDWRIFFQWMYVSNHTIQGPLRDIITIRSYGDVFFVGSNWGVLRIYLKPYSSGQLDLFNSEPIKQYNFMERNASPVLSIWSILQIDVSEANDGHTVFVAMPQKIAVLKFMHDFQTTTSVTVLPYSNVRNMKI